MVKRGIVFCEISLVLSQKDISYFNKIYANKQILICHFHLDSELCATGITYFSHKNTKRKY